MKDLRKIASGGGALLGLISLFDSCKKTKICYDIDIKHHSNKNRAFTLAEVLITLGIIGVVAAITMPVLISKYRAQVFETQFKKAYSSVQNATQKC